MKSNSTIEVVGSSEWIEDIRDRLDYLRDCDGSIEASVIDSQIEMHLQLAQASVGLMDELPKIERPTRAKKKMGNWMGGLKAVKTTQHHTLTYSLDYHPRHGHGVVHSELFGSGSFARVVELNENSYEKRPFVPLMLGSIALKDKLGTARFVGLEFNSHAPIEPHLLDMELDHIYCIVDTDVSKGERFNPTVMTGLAEGLHAVAVSCSQVKPEETDLREPGALR